MRALSLGAMPRWLRSVLGIVLAIASAALWGVIAGAMGASYALILVGQIAIVLAVSARMTGREFKPRHPVPLPQTGETSTRSDKRPLSYYGATARVLLRLSVAIAVVWVALSLAALVLMSGQMRLGGEKLDASSVFLFVVTIIGIPVGAFLGLGALLYWVFGGQQRDAPQLLNGIYCLLVLLVGVFCLAQLDPHLKWPGRLKSWALGSSMRVAAPAPARAPVELSFDERLQRRLQELQAADTAAQTPQEAQTDPMRAALLEHIQSLEGDQAPAERPPDVLVPPGPGQEK